MKILRFIGQLLIIAIALLGISKIMYTVGTLDTMEVNTYYDGEGNKLPKEAITALVRSQYVITTKAEDSLITKYFK